MVGITLNVIFFLFTIWGFIQEVFNSYTYPFQNWDTEFIVVFFCTFIFSIPPTFLFIRDFRRFRSLEIVKKEQDQLLDSDRIIQETIKRIDHSFHPIKLWTIISAFVQGGLFIFLSYELVWKRFYSYGNLLPKLITPSLFLISAIICLFHALRKSKQGLID